MSAWLHAKRVGKDRRKVWYVRVVEGNNVYIREYPECRTRSEVYDILRKIVKLPPTASNSEVFEALTKSGSDAFRGR